MSICRPNKRKVLVNRSHGRYTQRVAPPRTNSWEPPYHLGPRIAFPDHFALDYDEYNHFLVIEMLDPSFDDPRKVQKYLDTSRDSPSPLSSDRERSIRSVHLIPGHTISSMYDDDENLWLKNQNILEEAVDVFPCLFYHISNDDVSTLLTEALDKFGNDFVHLHPKIDHFFENLGEETKHDYERIENRVTNKFYVSIAQRASNQELRDARAPPYDDSDDSDREYEE